MKTPLCHVRSGGLLTTIQDLGRPGYRRFGVPISGAMDQPNAKLANRLVGNAEEAALLEITQVGPLLHFETYGALAITGANLSPTLNAVPVPNNETIFFSKGDRLKFGELKSGLRCYLAFSGELEAEQLFNSKSTHIGNGWGGLLGRKLEAGDVIYFEPASHSIKAKKCNMHFKDHRRIRLQPSLEFEALGDPAIHQLFNQGWSVSSDSNRTGIRLIGTPLSFDFPDMISGPTDIGILQLPPNGLPIILMNDSASIGGYPRICSVIQEDIPLLVQKQPGTIIHFRLEK